MALATLLALLAVACGRPDVDKKYVERRLKGGPIFGDRSDRQDERTHDAAAAESPTGADAQAGATPAATPEDEKDLALEVVDDKVSSKVYDEYLRQPIAGIYFQADARLEDLFDPSGGSQLCWPAAMAYQMRYQRTLRDPSFVKLPDVASDFRDGEAKRAAETRYFASACKTSPETGTTMPQGAACLDQHFRKVGLLPRLTVTGIDSQWAAFGMYPTGTTVRRDPVTPATLRKDLEDGRGVIMLIGFYTYDEDRDAWVRERGHFVSVVGYGYKSAWDEDQMTLRLANPANDYVAFGAEEAFDAVTMARLDLEHGRPPENATYGLVSGTIPGDPYLAVVESTVAFDAAKH
jgi:hypothetical protein